MPRTAKAPPIATPEPDDDFVPAHVLERLKNRDPNAPTYSLQQVCDHLGLDYDAIQRTVQRRIRARKRAKAPRAT